MAMACAFLQDAQPSRKDRIRGQTARERSADFQTGLYGVGVGLLTFPQANDVRVIKVVAMGERRGPAPEAQLLYEDLDPPKPREAVVEQVPRFEGKGRPTKKDRRAMQQTRTDLLE